MRSEIYRVIDEAKLLSLLKFGGEPKDAIVNVEVRVAVVLVFWIPHGPSPSSCQKEVGLESPIATTLASRGALAADAWMECATALKDHDDVKIQGWKEEIDTHLVFVSFRFTQACICWRRNI